MSHVPLGRHDEAVVLLRAELYEFELDSNMSPSARRRYEMLELFFKYVSRSILFVLIVFDFFVATL